MSLRNASKWISGLTAVAALMSLGGCVIEEEPKSNPGPTGTVYTYPNTADFCAARAKAECSEAVVTQCRSSSDDSLAADQANCVAKRSGDCNPDRIGYHPELADPCVAAYDAAYKDGKIQLDELDAVAIACIGVFSKGGLVGASCAADQDCDAGGGLRCMKRVGGGTCQQPVEVGGGLKCDQPNQECASGFYCDSNLRCTVLAEAGEACSEDIPCDAASRCVDSVCEAKLVNNEPCTIADECVNGFCIKPAGSQAGKCGAVDQLASTSKSCDAF
jgi:hypothetical protein